MEMAKGSRTVVVTGSNSGIGKAAARRFAAEGDHVVMACQNVDAAEAARAEILAGSTGPTLTPAYAGAPEKVDRMWEVVREAIE